ncbi:hypothetical protein CCE28_11455 [Anaeromicrobium sediminis]|uniref:Choline/carnitine acyltransferase domain-containing protein n=1 Tax=Anaeromicrobium sediminis TaxID=1478221 RepID=A0A267MI54_9FIRM|nr:hypothetical protein CCE28_11455 [Anaeromicrobium sediminis]
MTKYSKLPTVPIPLLEDTMNKYLEWIDPLISKGEYKEAKIHVNDFLKKEGPLLQKKLKEWNKKNRGDWLKPLWYSMYLSNRDPVVINTNYFIKLNLEDVCEKYGTTKVAATLISSLMEFYEDVHLGRLNREKMKEEKLCMNTYKKKFKSTRVPRRKEDEYIVCKKNVNEHIIIMYRGNMFKIDLMDNNGISFKDGHIKNVIEELINLDKIKNKTNIGLITTGNREEGACILEEIMCLEENKYNFEMLKEALFIVCIDENSNSLREFAMNLLCENEENRYFDKSFQLIFNKKGNFGFNFEHTGADGSSWVNTIDILASKLEEKLCTFEEIEENKIPLEEIQWEICESTGEKLKKIQDQHKKLVEELHMEVISFQDFGKKHIKNMGFSPDAFLHLALQIGQYRVFNKFRNTSESISTRNFSNGRTESNKVVTREIVDLIMRFEKENRDNRKSMELMKKALNKHQERITQCKKGMGIERHLFGLYCMYERYGEELGINEIPKIFESKSYKTLKYDFISTSRIESTAF